MSTVLVTGGAGFIGSNLLLARVRRHPEHRFVNVDKLGYASSRAGLAAIEALPNYTFERCDLADRAAVADVLGRHRPDRVIHLAAESHVDRSIDDPGAFIQSNVVGTFNLLEGCRRVFPESGDAVFLQVTTDEVFGSLGGEGLFDEESRIDPSSPYSASKAASDHLVRAYHRTYGLPVKVSLSSNNYGPRQFPEKLVPLALKNLVECRPVPVYGRGDNVRDWIYVEDHVEAIWRVLERGAIGRTYAIGARAERTNLEVIRALCRALARVRGDDIEELARLVTFVPDRPGHDLRYAIDPTRVEEELGFTARETFSSGIEKTVRWYLDNPSFPAETP